MHKNDGMSSVFSQKDPSQIRQLSNRIWGCFASAIVVIPKPKIAGDLAGLSGEPEQLSWSDLRSCPLLSRGKI